MRLTRHLMQEGFEVQLVGLGGTMERPHMLMPLRSNILRYVHTIAFRGTDSALRVWLKRLSCFLPAGLAWRGPLVLVASPESVPFDRFVLMTEDREIAFLFRDQEKAPWAVRKSGVREELAAEYHKHSRAFEILCQRVPAVMDMTKAGSTASITFEAINERFLGNIVAAAFLRKKQVFIREALGHLDFCLEVYRLLAARGSVERVVVTEEEVYGLLAGIDRLPGDAVDASLLKQALVQTVGITLPKLMQHGDFCVRNILIAGGDRGRVLIDWEDMHERRWPLADFVLLRLSLKEVYADLFSVDLAAMEHQPALVKGLAATEAELMGILHLDRPAMRAAQLLSLACLCQQNLDKGRLKTATAIFRELMAFAHNNLEKPEIRDLP
jgi:hypothetical protein